MGKRPTYNGSDADGLGDTKMGIVTRIEPDGRLRFPEELQAEFAPDQEVIIARRDGGVLITPV